MPFHHDNIHKLLRLVTKGEYKMPQHISEPAKHLLTRLLTRDPHKRITLAEIRQHAWFHMVPVDHYAFATLPIQIRPPLAPGTVVPEHIITAFLNLGWSDRTEVTQALMSNEYVLVYVCLFSVSHFYASFARLGKRWRDLYTLSCSAMTFAPRSMCTSSLSLS